MIKRITYVKNFRCYQRWKQSPGAIDFQALNVIYAPNGTGKSTLATLLSGVPEDKEWTHGLKALIQPGDSEERDKVEAPGHWDWSNVCLFNAEYVRKNLRFDSEDTETGAPALMYFGKPSVEQKKRREEALQRIQELTKQLKELQKQHRKATRERQNTAKNVGGMAVNTLASFNNRFKRGFNAGHVEQALRQPLTPLDELARFGEQDNTLLGNQVWKPVSEVLDPGLTTQDLWDQVNTVRQRTVRSTVIEELAADSAHSTWVRRGMDLHHGRDTCLFCGSALEESRTLRLEEHFDEGYARLESEITGVHERINDLRRQAERLVTELPHAVQFLEHLRSFYEAAAKEVRGNVDGFLLLLDRLASSLDEKRGSMFLPLTPVDLDVVGSLDLSAVNSLIEEHNEGTRSQEEDRARAAERRFQRMLYDVQDTWQQLCDEEASLHEQIKVCEDELARCREVLKETPDEGMNPDHFLPTLNNDIASLLSRKELSFDHVDGHYRVLRDGEPARHLSEGERTVIALLYFLKSLEERGRDLERTIVVVDDPVSSLDDHLMQGVHSTLVTRLDPGVLCRQLFVFTHSTTFLRYWRDTLTPGKRREKWPAKGTLHFMKSSLHPDPDNAVRMVRRPVLDPVDLTGPEFNALSTEYALVFYRAARDLLASLGSSSVNDDVRLATSTPNDARKILEHVLQFKFPKQGENLTSALDQALKDEPVRLQRLKAYVHGNSHRSPAGDAWQLLDPETRDALIDVFFLIRQTDRDHFDGMCARLGLTDHVPLLTGR
ncbi:AAA family ATPase [Nocardiopsis dassonvillei]|uniref:AAA family ATPase n=1 Tax=Nocardiopsis dassonvillei TaxID=2014 RepID=UPI00367204BB